MKVDFDKSFVVFGLTICAVTFVTMTAGTAILLSRLIEHPKGRGR